MKKIVTISLLALTAITLSNCKKDKEEKLKDRKEVYIENINKIEHFLKTNKLVVEDTHTISFKEVEEGNQEAIWTKGELKSIMVKDDTRRNLSTSGTSTDTVSYKLYYVVLNEGGGNSVKKYDNLYTSYSAYTLNKELFDKNTIGFWSSYPRYGNEASYPETISGFRQILEQIKTAENITEHPDGSFDAINGGRVVVFIPSGLAYFSGAKNKLGVYSPAIFDINLLYNKEVDHDGDGILTKYEVNTDGDLWTLDTDKDGKPNFLDVDDDADGTLTKKEISYTTKDSVGNTIIKVYDFDDIPTCSGGSLKKHLDPSCQ